MLDSKLDVTSADRAGVVRQVTEDDLAKYFGLLGEVNNVIMLRDKFTNRHKVRPRSCKRWVGFVGHGRTVVPSLVMPEQLYGRLSLLKPRLYIENTI